MRKLMLLGLVGLLLVPAPVAGQEGIQVGAGAAAVRLRKGGDFWGEGLAHAGGEVRMSVPLARRFSLETSMTFGKRTVDRGFTDQSATVEAVEIRRSEKQFSVLIKQNLGSRTKSYPYLVYGLAGFAGTTYYPETRISYPNGKTYVYPANTYKQKDQFGFPQLGVGFEQGVSKHLAVRADARALLFLFVPVGWRASVSVGYTFRRR